jgi:hypothetical protein
VERVLMRPQVRFATVLWVFCLATAALAVPTADQALTDFGFSAADKQRLLHGEYVTSKMGAVSDRDLSLVIAFFLKTSPDALSKQVIAGDLMTADHQVKAYGTLSAAGSPADFSALQVDGEEAEQLALTEAGERMNLSAGEIALAHEHRGDSAQGARARLIEMLLTRYQSYRASGLAGIAPYDRGGGHVSDIAADLTRATQAATELQRCMPALHALLLVYPRRTLPGLQERFFWMKSVIRGKATYVLAHFLVVGEGEARAVVRREFYVSAGYNAEQTIAGFLPVEGGTIVVYTSHAFTDQVAGASGSLKRSIGSRIMADQLKEMFEAGRKRIER